MATKNEIIDNIMDEAMATEECIITDDHLYFLRETLKKHIPATHVKICNSRTGQSYFARREADCKDNTDLSLYRSVIQQQNVVCMGIMVGELV